MYFDATVLIQQDLPARKATARSLDIPLVELTDKDGDTANELGLLDTGWPAMAPGINSESLAGCWQIRTCHSRQP